MSAPVIIPFYQAISLRRDRTTAARTCLRRRYSGESWACGLTTKAAKSWPPWTLTFGYFSGIYLDDAVDVQQGRIAFHQQGQLQLALGAEGGLGRSGCRRSSHWPRAGCPPSPCPSRYTSHRRACPPDGRLPEGYLLLVGARTVTAGDEGGLGFGDLREGVLGVGHALDPRPGRSPVLR